MKFLFLFVAVLVDFTQGNEEICDVQSDGSCFVAILGKMNHHEAVKACEELGGSLANIYSNEQMDDLKKFYNDHRMDGIGRLDLRTGMKFEHSNLLHRDGSVSDAGLRWAPTWPRPGLHSWHDVVLTILKEWGGNDNMKPEGLTNKPSSNRYNALCEFVF